MAVKNIFWFECKTKIIFLIISSSIHIRICENVFLIINTRWCKMLLLKIIDDMLQKCAKNAQIQTTPPKICHNGKYVVALRINCCPKSWRPKQHLNQNWDKLWAICVVTKRGWDPINLLILHQCNLCIMGMSLHKYFTIGQCYAHNINHKHLPNNVSNPKPNNTTQ